MHKLTVGMLYLLGGCVMLTLANSTPFPTLTAVLSFVPIIIGWLYIYGKFGS